MSDKKQVNERPRRSRDFEDRDFERPVRRRKQQQQRQPTKYVFRVHGKPKPPAEVHFDREPKLWDILSTSEGPHKVVEVFWSGCEGRGWRADIMLRPIELKDADKQAVKHGAKQTTKKPSRKPASRSASRTVGPKTGRPKTTGSKKPRQEKPKSKSEKNRRYAKMYGG